MCDVCVDVCNVASLLLRRDALAAESDQDEVKRLLTSFSSHAARSYVSVRA